MADPSRSRLFRILESGATSFSAADAERIAREHFDVTGSATELRSERDQNFHLRTAGEEDFVLKIANALEDPASTRFETDALLHVAAAAPELSVPRVRPTPDGATEALIDLGDGRRSSARLLTYLHGRPSARVPSTPRLRADAGATLARLDRALRGFDHEAADRELLWDLQRTPAVAPLVPHVQEKTMRSLVARRIERFEETVLPRLRGLRSQVIYNDANPSNLLVDASAPERIAGIIDFGDIIRAPLVIDVAVAAVYQLPRGEKPLEGAAELVAGFHAVTPLEESEIGLLFDLIMTRLALSVTITSWRAALHPENREYILRNSAANRRMLERLAATPFEAARRQLAAACREARSAPADRGEREPGGQR